LLFEFLTIFSLNVEPEEPKSCVSAPGNYSRKEKSLGELSKRFLTMFGRVKECLISLDSVTKQLGNFLK